MGTENYGQMDRVPGLCSVNTQFYHVNYFPLIPLQSQLADEDGVPLQMEPIPLSSTSVLLGYYRGWVGIVTGMLFGGIMGFLTHEVFSEWLNGIYCALMGGATGVILSFISMKLRHRTWIVATVILIAVALAFLIWNELRQPVPARDVDLNNMATVIIVAVLCLFSVNILRVYDIARLARACELGKYFNMSTEEIRKLYAGQANADDDYHTDLDPIEP